MTKSTWKNIYNFDTVESNLDINDVISSVSETTDFERNVRNNITKLNAGYKNHKLIPLVFNLETEQIGGNNIEDSISIEQLENKLKSIFTNTNMKNNQSGGNNNVEDSISTEQIENKLKNIFTNLNYINNQSGGNNNIEDSISTDKLEYQLNNIFMGLDNAQTGGDCGEDHEKIKKKNHINYNYKQKGGQTLEKDDSILVPLIISNEIADVSSSHSPTKVNSVSEIVSDSSLSSSSSSSSSSDVQTN